VAGARVIVSARTRGAAALLQTGSVHSGLGSMIGRRRKITAGAALVQSAWTTTVEQIQMLDR